tara:strand:+ start:117 stop:1265 length:1149 start_codon:yes stop_codon:yes gene_type:complete
MKIAVIGAGTVGVLTVCHFLGYAKDVQVVCVHNPKKNILGIGESSTVRMTELLWNTLNFNVGIDGEDLQCTIKTGVKFKNWREHEFTSPMFFPGYGMHFDNFKLAEVIFSKVQQKYNDRFNELKIDIESLDQNDDEVIINKTYKFDYVIDCRGFPKDYSNYTMVNLPINHCIVHAVDKPGDWNFTYHIAHENGWMFGIPLRKRQGWGYLYNDEITSKKEAVDNFNKITQQNINYENVREYKFKPFKANKYVNGRIMLNGNSALFYEPIEAISGGFYESLNSMFYGYIFKKNNNEEQLNKKIHYLANKYLNFISFIYHGGSIYDTKFWEHAKQICTNNLKNDGWLETVEAVKQGEESVARFPFSCGAWNVLDKHLYDGKIFNV